MTKHDELVALLTEIRDRLPIDDATNARYEREDAEARQDEPDEAEQGSPGPVNALIEQIERAEAERDEWKARHAALRADVEGMRRGVGQGLWPDFKGILDRDDERGAK